MPLMDRLFRKQGRPQSSISPLDRLAFIGERGMGALSYVPHDPVQLTAEDIQLLDLAMAAQTLAKEKTAQYSSNWHASAAHRTVPAPKSSYSSIPSAVKSVR
jgi:hypothetical protein